MVATTQQAKVEALRAQTERQAREGRIISPWARRAIEGRLPAKVLASA
jgi:hypothetical protein